MVLGLVATPAAVAVIVIPAQDLGGPPSQHPFLLLQYRMSPAKVDQEAVLGEFGVVWQPTGHDRPGVVVTEDVVVDHPVGSGIEGRRPTVDQEQLLSTVEQEPATGAVLEVGWHGE
jgi:hypothetical protein